MRCIVEATLNYHDGESYPFAVYIPKDNVKDGIIVGDQRGMVPYSTQPGDQECLRTHELNLILGFEDSRRAGN